MIFLHQFAAETATEPGLLGALGIDWRLLAIQIVAFLILVAVLKKLVYPWMMKQVDQREANIEAAAKAAAQAEKSTAKNKEAVAELLDSARREAHDIIASARHESTEMLSTSEAKAKTAAERIVADAHQRIDKDIAAARQSLRDETIELVALAAEKIIGAEMTDKLDRQRIERVLRETK